MASGLGLRKQPYSYQINIFYVYTLFKLAGRYSVVLVTIAFSKGNSTVTIYISTPLRSVRFQVQEVQDAHSKRPSFACFW